MNHAAKSVLLIIFICFLSPQQTQAGYKRQVPCLKPPSSARINFFAYLNWKDMLGYLPLGVLSELVLGEIYEIGYQCPCKMTYKGKIEYVYAIQFRPTILDERNIPVACGVWKTYLIPTDVPMTGSRYYLVDKGERGNLDFKEVSAASRMK